MLAELRNTLGLVTRFCVWLGVILFSFPEAIVDVLAGESYAQAATYLQLVSPLAFTSAVLPVFTMTLFAMDRPWHATLGLGSETVLLVGLVLFAGARISPIVLSFAVVLTSLVGLLVQWLLVRYALKSGLLSSGLIWTVLGGVVSSILLRYGLSLATPVPRLWQVAIGVGFSLVYWLVATRPDRLTGHSIGS
jgi:O-antigen/teichoic acid export membrane protein